MAWTHDNFDLRDWKITFPVDEDYFDGGGNVSDGRAYEVLPNELEGFEAEEFFYYDESEGGMVFRSPVEGATTSSGTRYTRTELREMEGDSLAAWTVGEGGVLSATLKITDFAEEFDGDPARVIVGQIHGQDDELCRLYVDSAGEVYYANEITSDGGEERFFKFVNSDGERPNFAQGETFSYIIDVSDGRLNVAVYVDGEVYTADGTVFDFDDGIIVPTGDTIDPAEIVSDWEDDSFYFKAGVYQGVSDPDRGSHFANGDGVTEAVFYAIDFGHEDGEGRGAWLGDGPIAPNPPVEPPVEPPIDPEPPSSGGVDDGDSGDNTLTGTSAGEEIKGREGDDKIFGLGGDDILWGNEDDDTLVGGAGSDWMKGGNGADTFVLTDTNDADVIADFSRPNGDRIDLTAVLEGANGFTQSGALSDGYVVLTQNGSDAQLYIDLDGENGGADLLLLATLEDEDAGDFENSDFVLPSDTPAEPQPPTSDGGTITVTSGADDITGTSGDDEINAGGGGDDVLGGAGNDVIRGQGGWDELRGGEGDDVVRGNRGNDLVKGGVGNDRLHGGSGSDEIWGEDGDDVIYGGRGNDWMKGGNGADTYVFNTLDGRDTIADFSLSDGDVLDVSRVLDNGVSEAAALTEGFVRFEQDGADTRLYVDADGGANDWVYLATLLDETASDLGAGDLIA